MPALFAGDPADGVLLCATTLDLERLRAALGGAALPAQAGRVPDGNPLKFNIFAAAKGHCPGAPLFCRTDGHRPCTSSATSRSSRTSTTASRRWRTVSSSAAAASPTARWTRRCWTRWTSSASAGITIKAQTAALTYTARDGRSLQPQPDRHAGPRRLRLRGVALARRLRRRAAGRRRVAGGRGADRRELLHRDRAGRHRRAGAEQDRPALGRARPRDRGDRGHHRHSGARRAAGEREDRRGRRRRARGGHRADSGAERRSGGAAVGARSSIRGSTTTSAS